MATKTIKERLEELDKVQSSTTLSNELEKKVFSIQSGTKDIKRTKLFGRDPKKIKKINRNYPEFDGSTARQVQILRANHGFGGNISRAGFLPNHEVKPTMSPFVTRVIGMEEAGGKGTQYAEGFIKRKEEMSQTKKAFLRDDM